MVECRENEPICYDESSDPDGPFCFFYATFFKKNLLRLPLSIFEKELLIEINVALAQLHPNSWAFIRAFKILCSQIDILPTVEVFLYFFEAKYSGYQLWVSLNGALEELCSPSSNHHTKFLKVNSLKSSFHRRSDPIGPLNPDSKVLDD